MNKTLIQCVLILLSVFSPLLSAQESSAAGQPYVMVYSSPEQPVAGSRWALYVLVAHDKPGEVNVLAPPFAGPLFMEQMNKGLRSISGNELWTALEYRFVMNSPGTVHFGAFTVTTPQGQTATAPFDVRVLGPSPGRAAQPQTHRLVWEEAPQSVGIGESAVLRLRFSGRVPPAFPGETGLLTPPVPVGHIVEALPLTGEERLAGLALKLRIIPLQTVPFVLESRRVSAEGLSADGALPAVIFEIPELRIPVRQTSIFTKEKL